MDRAGQCSQGAESRVVLVDKNLFNFCILCTKHQISKSWTEVTLRIHTFSVTRLVLVIIFMPLWIKDRHLLIARNSIPSQPKGKTLLCCTKGIVPCSSVPRKNNCIQVKCRVVVNPLYIKSVQLLSKRTSTYGQRKEAESQ
ncbi:hypothetical protein EK904_010055 [Melospiza melodia maxima]|nr:hypothetical protein EK904_010055 [Melospiza melodia maxima]